MRAGRPKLTMKDKKQPLRMCAVCRVMKEKKDLVRVVRKADGSVFADSTGKAAGRGVYVCTDAACAQKLVKQKALNRAFKCEIAPEVYGDVLKLLAERDNNGQ